MNISYNWLKRYLKTDLSAEEMATILTDIGLEVESFEKIESIRGGLAGVVVGEVLTCTDHPDSDPSAPDDRGCRRRGSVADRLRCSQLSAGSQGPLRYGRCGALP